MTTLVTGGNGFIGAWLLKRLHDRGDALRVFDTVAPSPLVRELLGADADGLDWTVGDIRDRAGVSAAVRGCDRIIHLAGILTPACAADPILGAEVNLMGTLHVFLAALEHGVRRVVYASSAGAFGPDHGRHPEPSTHYGAFKLACEGSARAFWEDHGLPSVGFRPYVVYGPGRTVGLTAGPSLACRAAARGETYTIPYSGPSGLVHVDDVAAAFDLAAAADLPGAPAFTLAGHMVDTDALVAEIKRQVPGAAIDADGPLLPISGELASDDVASALPGWTETALADGIAATIAYYR